MENYNEIKASITQECIEKFQTQGISFCGIDEESGGLKLADATGHNVIVNLQNLIEYYITSEDENSVDDFVSKIIEAINPTRKISKWDEVKSDIFISLYPDQTNDRRPFAKNITAYCYRHFIVDTPNNSMCIMDDMPKDWGVTEDDLEKQAFENANNLLADTFIEIGNVEGHPLGSFNGNKQGVRDRTIVGALLLAPDLKKKISKDFGWPVYAILPDKVTCYFFSKEHYDYFEPRIGKLVAEKYKGTRHITPELLEFSDNGVKAICSWTEQMGYIIKFDGETDF